MYLFLTAKCPWFMVMTSINVGNVEIYYLKNSGPSSDRRLSMDSLINTLEKSNYYFINNFFKTFISEHQ